MKMFKKSSIPQLDLETASRILEHAFEANQMETNTIPLDVLVSYSNYRRERFTLQRTVLVVIMTLFLLLPLLFIPSSFTVEQIDTDTPYNPVFRLEVDSFMLVERVSASIDGSNIPVYETDAHVYSIEPTKNGQMAVTVTLVNKQTRTEYIDVTAVDREVPVVTSCTRDDDHIYLYLSDWDSGVDFPAIQAVSLSGTAVIPDSMDPVAGCVIFTGVTESLNVFVPDLAGNKLQIVLTIH